MKTPNLMEQPEMQVAEPSRRARLQALLFTSATLGTTLVTLGLLDVGKHPWGGGE